MNFGEDILTAEEITPIMENELVFLVRLSKAISEYTLTPDGACDVLRVSVV